MEKQAILNDQNAEGFERLNQQTNEFIDMNYLKDAPNRRKSSQNVGSPYENLNYR